MSTKKNKNEIGMINTATNTAFTLVTKANGFALETTEKVFNTGFSVAEKCISLSGKIVNRGLKISAAQQDMVFNVLDSVKGKIVKK